MQALNPAPASATSVATPLAPNPAAANSAVPARPEPLRPLLADPAAAEARFLVRHPIYLRLAHLTLDTAALTPDETVAALLTRLT